MYVIYILYILSALSSVRNIFYNVTDRKKIWKIKYIHIKPVIQIRCVINFIVFCALNWVRLEHIAMQEYQAELLVELCEQTLPVKQN